MSVVRTHTTLTVYDDYENVLDTYHFSYDRDTDTIVIATQENSLMLYASDVEAFIRELTELIDYES